MAQKHLIGKQVFEIGVKSSEDVYAIQQVLGDLFRKDLVPALEKLFNRIADQNEMIRIDRVELNIGEIDLRGNRTESIVNQIISLLEKECLASKRESAVNGRESGHLEKRSFSKALKAHYFDLWLYWLEKGALPSYTLQPEENWIQQILTSLGTDHTAVSRLRDILKKSPVALHRLVLQHTPDELTSITELYTGYNQSSLLLLFDEIKRAVGLSRPVSKITYRQLETDLWIHVFKKVILEGQKPDNLTLRIDMMKFPPLSRLVKELSGRDNVIRDSFPIMREMLQSDLQNMPVKEWPDIERTTERSTPDGQEHQRMETPQFFNNAGVVLLHPFLNHFFEKIYLLDGSSFKDHDSRCKAIMLLQFLATGEEYVPEYDLILMKFLCGMPVNLPLDHTLELTSEEKQEAENVLQSAITHWNALGTTSPDGLREGFLVRDGKLEKEQSGWKLHVEQKPIDVLLDKLPWTLSVIKLPWMKEMLKVEWR